MRLPVFAASGLVIHQGTFFIVSDDEVKLLHGNPDQGFRSYELLAEILPEDEKERKIVKPDFESLFLSGHHLYLIPSMSRKNRVNAMRVKLSHGDITEHEEFPVANLRERLNKLVLDLNVEGCVEREEKLHLFQRGNGERGMNSVIILHSLEAKDFDVRPIHLSKIGEVPYTITDVTLWKNDIWFLAVAEDTKSTFLDGEVLGSAVGKFDENFHAVEFHPLELKGKAEGIAFDVSGDLWLVTDDDSRKIPSRLLRIKDFSSRSG